MENIEAVDSTLFTMRAYGIFLPQRVVIGKVW